ncbi:MAG: phosphotransacetylase family protein [Dissulfurimicrobium sp.]|uniref:phosphotransacetylase family protein n=1 Tax=Dissulfurimicrobium TaxID=1769732 RepID=UPI001EDB860C|nr:phosphotransacetylase family protein [Dissulfurimicrobium hydrothermale]UKL14412.1 phosphotransacetylase family protein [Dissulfurimicrobium hydrothermale]
MTKSIYVTSTQNFSGKSALCAGLINRFQKKGLKTGYMKPLSTNPKIVDGKAIDEDAAFIKTTFKLADPIEAMSPTILNNRVIEDVLKGMTIDFPAAVNAAFNIIADGKDIVILEGGASLREGWFVNLAPVQTGPSLSARSLVVVPFETEMQVLDDLITAQIRLGDSMVGAVINRVNVSKIETVHGLIRPYLEKRGIAVLGVLPKEKLLTAASVEEFLEGLGGDVLCAKKRLDELVENIMIGAMSFESALRFFRRKRNKAVITGGDRPDIQLAALETSTKCLILTGGLRPSPMIIGKAEEAGVPVILTNLDTMGAIEVIENFFGKSHFHQPKKLSHLDGLLKERMDFMRLDSLLGIK